MGWKGSAVADAGRFPKDYLAKWDMLDVRSALVLNKRLLDEHPDGWSEDGVVVVMSAMLTVDASVSAVVRCLARRGQAPKPVRRAR